MNMIRRITRYLLTAALALGFGACSSEDDIEEIFTSHPWYVTNIYYTASKTSALQDQTVLFRANSYYIEFAANGTLKGKTAQNEDFSGKWKANGSNHTLSISVTGNTSSSDKGTGSLMLQVLNNAASYQGDSNVLTIHTKNSGQYYMTLGSKEK